MSEPTTSPSLNLDDLERPDTPEPYRIHLGGRDYTLIDPQDVDYRDLLDAYRAFFSGQPEKLVEMAVPEDDHEEFFANRLENWKLRALFDGYNKHYGLDPGEASASPAS